MLTASRNKSAINSHRRQQALHARKYAPYKLKFNHTKSFIRSKPVKFWPPKNCMSEQAIKDREEALRGEPTNVLHWIDKVDRVAAKLSKVVGGSPHQYLETLYNGYTTSKNSDPIFDAIIYIDGLHSHLQSYHGHILQLVGVGQELKSAEEVITHFDNVRRSLEDLGAMVFEEQDVIELHTSKQFLYQTILLE
ncbi:hypothetical protein H2248_010064 [Termitomyces sp. 'cryptogamus']|nr:hypothetical protein H2248_010064 [Termitomyces sp. 'cryptogamus']